MHVAKAFSSIFYTTYRDTVMTRSRLSPEPVPAPAQPQTDPRRFIADTPRVASRHVTHSRHAHPQTRASTSWHMQPPVVHAVFLPALESAVLYKRPLRTQK